MDRFENCLEEILLKFLSLVNDLSLSVPSHKSARNLELHFNVVFKKRRDVANPWKTQGIEGRRMDSFLGRIQEYTIGQEGERSLTWISGDFPSSAPRNDRSCHRRG